MDGFNVKLVLFQAIGPYFPARGVVGVDVPYLVIWNAFLFFGMLTMDVGLGFVFLLTGVYGIAKCLLAFEVSIRAE